MQRPQLQIEWYVHVRLPGNTSARLCPPSSPRPTALPRRPHLAPRLPDLDHRRLAQARPQPDGDPALAAARGAPAARGARRKSGSAARVRPWTRGARFGREHACYRAGEGQGWVEAVGWGGVGAEMAGGGGGAAEGGREGWSREGVAAEKVLGEGWEGGARG